VEEGKQYHFLTWTFSGILARSIPSDLQDLEKQGISPITIVICNLYPFTETIAKPGCTIADAIEEIDIGGVTLLRAAAKNHARVSILSDPNDYQEFIKKWAETSGQITDALRSRLALKAFEMTAKYDGAISSYFRQQYVSADLPTEKLAGPIQRLPLRYGANPHQKPAEAFVEGQPLPFKGTASSVSLIFSIDLTLFCSLVWLSRLYQSVRCAQLLCSCEGVIRGLESSRSDILQTRFSCGSCRRASSQRRREDRVWR
jgi:AICAR transformylase/IMP cyclohydrolase PurH